MPDEVAAELRQQLERARERERTLRLEHESLLDALHEMVGALTAQEQYHAVLRAGQKTLACQGGLLLGPEGILATTAGLVEVPPAEAACLARVRRGSIVAIADTRTAGLWDDLLSALFIPLDAPGAVLVLLDRRKGWFTQRSLRAARKLQPLAAQAVRNAEQIRSRREQEQRLLRGAGALLEASPSPHWLLDLDLQLATSNPAFTEWIERVFPSRSPRAPGTLSAEAREAHRALVPEVLRTGHARVEWRSAEGDALHEVSLFAVEVDGRRVGIAASAHDITARTRAADLLKSAKEEAESANRAKSTFVAEISHELRTPLNAIVGLTDLVARHDTPHETAALIERIHVNSASLLHLVNDILDFSKIEAGRLQVHPEPDDPTRIVTEVVDFLRARAQERGLAYTLDIDDDVPHRVLIDAARLRQVTTNLVANAIKYTPRGSVLVQVFTQPAKRGFAELVVRVVDTGVGIPRRDQKRIFTRFYRAYRSSSGRTAGTGLGLAITKSLVDLMDGAIDVDSAPGQGSTFTIRLPVRVLAWTGPVPIQPSPEPRPLTRAIRVLVADDNPDNLAVTRAILTRQGDEVVEVVNGREAVEAFFREGPFDAVLMDVDMPVMDGVHATVEIRAREGELGHARTPVLALTAHATLDVRRRCGDSGMDAFLTKPIEPNLLLQALDEHANRSPTILVVDDARDGRLVLRKVIERAGGHAVTASGVTEALAVIDQFAYDALLIDHDLQDGDGITLTRTLRERGVTAPILGCTGHKDRDERWRAAGAVDVLHKPVLPDELIRRLTRLPRAPRPVGLDPALQDLLPLYHAERRKDLVALRRALAAGRFEVIRKTAHRIRGTGTSYGYPRLTQLGEALEQAAREEDGPACGPLIDAMADQLP